MMLGFLLLQCLLMLCMVLAIEDGVNGGDSSTSLLTRLNLLSDIEQVIAQSGLDKGGSTTLALLGLFAEEAAGLEEEQANSAALEVLTSTAQALHAHVKAYIIDDPYLITSLHLEHAPTLPTFLLLSEEDRSLVVQYTGEMAQKSVSTWIMQHFAHTAVSLLSLTAPEAVLYSQQFFAAKRLKFILFLRPQDLGLSAQSPAAVDVGPGGEAAAGEEGKLLTIWRTIADAYKEHAIFAYMLGVGDRDTEILQFFHVEASTELPCVGAYDPATDSKFRSTTTQPENAHLLEFVDGVVGGKVDKMLRSEVVVSPLAQQTQQAQLKGVSPVRLFGANVLQEVTKSGADTLLLVYNGPKANYQVRADFDALTSLFAAEKRLLLASIDVSRNDLPSTWLLSEANVGPKSPVLLWFPAGTGASEGRVLPREYITSEYSLENLVDFILQENSYRKGSASSVEEGASGSPLQHGPSADLLRAAQRAAAGLAGKYQERGKWVTRNEDRQKMPSAWLDWAAGEIVYDGKRWHVVGAVSVLIALFLESFLSSARLLQKKKENKSLLTRGVQTMGTGTGQAAAADAVGANADITSDTAGIAATKIAAAEPAPILIPSGNKATAAKASSPVKLAKTADPLEVAAKEEGEL